MKFSAVATSVFFVLFQSANARDLTENRRHAEIAHKRQVLVANSPSSAPSSTATPPPSYNTVSGASGAVPLSQLTSGMPSGTTYAASSTYSPGSVPSYYPAPALPQFVFQAGQWPPMDVIVDPTTPQVQTWMNELAGYNIPNIPVTDGTCAGSPNSTANAAANGWWSCGGYTRVTDITACPNKLTWGLSFDDGPALYTQKLLTFLGQKSLLATFFVVGSRVIEYPSILVEEYMAGHEISVHTWSHHPLTSLTNEQIVGELGWTREAIKAVLGVTPTTMRPPFGDIDDRVRAISLAMGMTPIIWTSAPQSGPFDTNDWKVAGGLVTGTQSLNTFEAILGNATTLNTGFIVLEHDLYEVTVDLAVGYTLDAALTHTPPFTLQPIGQCVNKPITDLYLETNTNKTFPYPSKSGTASGSSSTMTGLGSPGSNTAKNSALTFTVNVGGILFVVGLLASLVIIL